MKHDKDRTRRNRGASGEATASLKEAKGENGKKKGLTGVFDIPGSALSGICHIEMAENREAVVDGCQGVMEYDENIVKLATGKMVVKFSGRNLQINALTRDTAVVTGFIMTVEFIV